MDKQDIIKYVMKTPENTNPAVLGDLLDQMGGGNPNYVETIEGTLANPWGNTNYKSLVEDIRNFNASTFIIIRIEEDYVEQIPLYAINFICGSEAGFTVSDEDPIELNGGFSVEWSDYHDDDSGSLVYSVSYNQGNITDYTANASQISTTLLIIHHPLPENNT